MNQHQMDPVALVAGVVAIIAGVVAILHQGGAISLDLPLVLVLTLMVTGVGGMILVVLENRRRTAVGRRAD